MLQGATAEKHSTALTAVVAFSVSDVMRSCGDGVVSKKTPPAFLIPLTDTARIVLSHSGFAEMTILTSADRNVLQQSMPVLGSGTQTLSTILKHVSLFQASM